MPDTLEQVLSEKDREAIYELVKKTGCENAFLTLDLGPNTQMIVLRVMYRKRCANLEWSEKEQAT